MPNHHDADALLIKIVAAIIVVVGAVWLWNQSEISSTPRVVRPPLIAQSGQLQSVDRPQDLSWSGEAVQSRLRKCIDSNGVESIQDKPCPARSTKVWEREVLAGASNREIATPEFGTDQSVGAVSPSSPLAPTDMQYPYQATYPAPISEMEQKRAQCQAARDNRESVLQQVGLNRTFDLLRRLNDQVFEACKDVQM